MTTWGIFKSDSISDSYSKLKTEGWDDMLKSVKDKNATQPNGGSGKKQGSRYGGGKQKDDEAQERKNKKNEETSVDKESMIADDSAIIDEEKQGEIVKMGAKEIKHANMKDKQDDAEIMEPHSEGEANFIDQHYVNVTDDATAGKQDGGAGKLGKATAPKGQGAGKYDGKGKTGVKEDTSEEGTVEEACGKKGSGKKSFNSFKAKVTG